MAVATTVSDVHPTCANAGKCGGKVITCDMQQFKVLQRDDCTQVTLPLQRLPPPPAGGERGGAATAEGLVSSRGPAPTHEHEPAPAHSPAVAGRGQREHEREVPWVPLDRDLFCCERCFQVSTFGLPTFKGALSPHLLKFVQCNSLVGMLRCDNK